MQLEVVVPLYEIIAGEKKVIMKMSSDALRWLFTLSSKVSINRRTRGGGWAIALHTLRVFKRDKQADGETEKFVSMAIDYCLSFGFILFWNAIDTTAVSQRDNHHALVLCSKEPLYHIGKCYLCVILPNLTQMTLAVKLLSQYTLLSLAACLSSSSLVLLTPHIVKTSAAYNTRSLE